MNFSAFWGSNSRALGLKNSSNLIKYLFPRLIKPPFWAKFVAKFLREGTKEVFKCHTYARMLPHYPPPPPFPLPRLHNERMFGATSSLGFHMLGVVRLRART